MTRQVWEERLWTTNGQLPKREDVPADHPMLGLPHHLRHYIADDLVLQPWYAHSLAPVPQEWQPLGEHQEAVYLVREQMVRVGLVDYHEGTVIAWRLRAGSTPYQPRKPRQADPP